MAIQVRTRIYLEDTDAGGVVYHASYLRLMERARTEFLRHYGIEQSHTFAEDVSFVVHSMKLEFRAPALLDAEVLTSCELVELKGARLSFLQEVREAASKTSLVLAEVSVACIGLSNKRPRRIPTFMIERLRAG